MIFRGSRFLEEVVFFHLASATIVLGDLIENFDPARLSWFHRTIARFGKVLAPNGQTPRDLRQTFRDHGEVGRSLETLLAWRPERIIFAHGLWVEKDAVAFLRRAFSWVRR
jgi:hypothetical protein